MYAGMRAGIFHAFISRIYFTHLFQYINRIFRNENLFGNMWHRRDPAPALHIRGAACILASPMSCTCFPYLPAPARPGASTLFRRRA
jgi:hypothetical protein